MDLLEILKNKFPQAKSDLRIEVGLSGGLDSVVLLHLLSRLRDTENFVLQAVHVHHGLSPFADEWADFCRRLCAEADIPLRVVKVQIDAKGKGIEAAARAARYRVFSDGLCGFLALAHHQDDQIETFMLAAARGGGLRALAGMPEYRALNGKTQIWRPLLGFTRKQLEDYAAAYGLVHIEDESNGDTAYLRNWLRHEALPQWENRIPHIARQVSANIRSLQNDLSLLDEITQDDYRRVVSDGLFIVEKWRGLSALRRQRLLHYFFQTHDIYWSSHKTILEIERILSGGAASGQWRTQENLVEYYRGVLWIMPQPTAQNFPWLADTPQKGRLKDILAANGFVLKPHRNGLDRAVLTETGTLCPPVHSDIIKLEYGHKSIKKLLHERYIFPSVRKIWPIVKNADNVCLSVANLKVNQDFQVEEGVLPVYQPFEKYIRN